MLVSWVETDLQHFLCQVEERQMAKEHKTDPNTASSSLSLPPPFPVKSHDMFRMHVQLPAGKVLGNNGLKSLKR